MPKVSGKEIISDLTEKNGRRLIVVSFLSIIVKLYKVNLSELSVFGVKLPAELFDVVALILITYFSYALFINWIGDLAGFRLWFDSHRMDSEFGTTMKLDKKFVGGGVRLLSRLCELEKNQNFPTKTEDIDSDILREFTDFKTNVELYCVRLDAAGKRFNLLSIYGYYYVWFQSFIFPMLLSASALYILFRNGSFMFPDR
ncbi:MAG: hypothetical protein KME43_24585 [Myxacorys chilensis ATA2-1-KO14]|jgi:hypothetical protein|nr:hypothetical protein [Myxacorys chilensis ATA2-1-KO14]